MPVQYRSLYILNFNMNKYKVYIIATVLLSVCMISIICACTLIVDPYGLYDVYKKNGFNLQKEGVRNKIRYVKAIEIALRRPATVLMGSSRVHDGINPDHPLLNQYPPVYNYGIDMIRIKEVKEYLKHAIQNAPIKRVVLGIDFFMFNAAEKLNPAFDPLLVGKKISPLDYVYTTLLTRTAVVDSFKTMAINRKSPDRLEFLPNGYRPAKYVFYRLKDYKKLHYYTNWIFLTKDPCSTPFYGIYKINDETFNDFEEIISICKNNKIDLMLFITPAHCTLDGEAISAAHLSENMDNWKRKLMKICSDHHTILWDFSGYNSITTEEVKSPMKYYWDSSHFSELASDYILKRMYHISDPNIPADFGVILKLSNVEQYLMETKSKRAQYILTHKGEINSIRDIVKMIDANLVFPDELSRGIFTTN